MQLRLPLLLLLLVAATARSAEPVPLRAGPLSMVFDADNAFLRYVRLGKHEVLRGINAPIRNKSWGTVPPDVSNVKLEDHGDRFRLTFDVNCHEGDVDFFWRGTIDGNSAGKLVFTFDGEARSTFLRNRIGFCLLHGPSAAGKPCRVVTVDDEMVEGHFPALISPHQPFKNIRTVSHEVTAGIWARVRLEGDIFEMEDQRNWTDASFKTYCTPLDLPRPVRVSKGTKILQKMELVLEGDHQLIRAMSAKVDGPLVLTIDQDQGARQEPLPGIGLQISSQASTLSETALNRLSALNLDHVRVDLTPSHDSSSGLLRRATERANALGVTLHVGLHLGDQPEQELAKLSAELETIRPPVSAWLILSTNKDVLQLARRYVSGAPVGVGVNTHFTELNRDRPDVSTIDLVAYGFNPQGHAVDDLSLIETLPIQGDTVRSARQFIGDLPLLISPITLRAQEPKPEPPSNQLPLDVDKRQWSLLNACWTLGSVKYLAEEGVESLTYFETVGWKGVMESQAGSPLAERFGSEPGTVFPVYHVLCDMGEFAGGAVRRTSSSDPLSVIGFALEKGRRSRLIVANMTNRAQHVTIRGISGNVDVFHLDSRNVRTAGRAPVAFRKRPGRQITVMDQHLALDLLPHGITRIDQVR